MSAYQCWVAQRSRLRESLQNASDAAAAAYLTRHALAQVEQNAMAEQPDDLLRQQTGILFSCCKTSLNLLDISITTRVWVARSQADKPKRKPAFWLLLPACAVQLGLALYAYFTNLPLLWIPTAVSFAATLAGWWMLTHTPAQNPLTDDRLKVTAAPDTDKLFSAIDAQMKAIDRYVNDFQYLNEQNALQNNTAEGKNIALFAELMEAVYECEGDAQENAVYTAERLLASAGVRAVPYASADARLFNILPSLTESRTLVPALLSAKDGALLYRGTAAVMEPAGTEGESVVGNGTPGEIPREGE